MFRARPVDHRIGQKTSGHARLASISVTLCRSATAIWWGAVLARFSGIADREAAEALKGVRLYVSRQALPATNEDEFYHADLVGLPVDTKDGARLGTVAAVHNFGAGDIIEVRDEKGGELLLPFSDPVFPVVDIKGGRLVADPPAELLEDRAKAAAKSAARDDRRRRLAERRDRAAGGDEPSGG